jgi:hypothetical protein
LNKSLLTFGIILIVGGVIVGIDLLVLLGIFLVIPGLLTTPKTQSKVPVSRKEPPPRRISPPPAAPTTPAAPAPTTEYLPPSSPAPAQMAASMSSYDFSRTSMYSTQGFTPALFPTAIFPPMAGQTTYRAPPVEMRERQQNQTDELLEIGVLLAALKLAFG